MNLQNSVEKFAMAIQADKRFNNNLQKRYVVN